MPTNLRAKYIVDSKGRRTAVILPIREFARMAREIEDLRDAQFVDEAEATAEEFIELNELRKGLSGDR